ncbi:MAG: hypothetical protein COB66_02215 [Coxiella sp. (in: Bacteria)]|nr:MAG: hypothetical protein COB66_02215 [Coxiella sp. (in: g-proteobacteria)]
MLYMYKNTEEVCMTKLFVAPIIVATLCVSGFSPFNKFEKRKIGGVAFGGHVGYRYEVMPALRVGVEGGYLNFGKSSSRGDGSTVNPLLTENYKYTIKDQAITLLGTVDYRVLRTL